MKHLLLSIATAVFVLSFLSCDKEFCEICRYYEQNGQESTFFEPNTVCGKSDERNRVKNELRLGAQVVGLTMDCDKE